jgi:ribosomal-protein-alanine N-acetyltransferase
MHILFETERLLVRQYTLADEEVFFRLNNDPDVVRYVRAPKSREESLEFLKENIAFYELFPYMGRWAIQLKSGGKVAGTFAILPIENSKDIQLGYTLLKEYWGNGYATEVCIRGRQFALDELHLPALYAITEPANTASQKVLLKSGFVQTTGIKEHYKELFRFVTNNPDYVETSRLKLFPLTAEQLLLYLEGDDKLEKRFHLAMNGRIVAPGVRQTVLFLTIPRINAAAGRNWLYYTFWLAVEKSSGTIIAELGFKGPPNRQGFIEIGYGTMPAHQGKGYMTEAVKGMLQWASQRKEVKGVLAETHRSNRASARVLEKNGFRQFDTRGEMLWWRVGLP